MWVSQVFIGILTTIPTFTFMAFKIFKRKIIPDLLLYSDSKPLDVQVSFNERNYDQRNYTFMSPIHLARVYYVYQPTLSLRVENKKPRESDNLAS